MRPLLVVAALLAVAPSVSLAQEDIFSPPVRDQWQRAPQIIAALGDVSGKRIVDLAAGDGYLTRHLSRAVGSKGSVVAVEISESALAKLTRMAADSFHNVTVVRGTESDPKLPADVEGVTILNSYHEITEIKATLAAIHKALKPGAILVLVDNNGFGDWNAKPREWQTSHHAIDPAIVEQELKAAGFTVTRRDDRFIGNPVDQWLIVARK
jgi:predicted methyltransferase